MRTSPVTLLALALLLGACASYDKLKTHDTSVDEQEVYSAGTQADQDEMVPHLVHVLEHHDDYASSAVVAALASLAERPDQRAVSAVAALATDPDEEVRWHVALALKAIGGEQAAATLAQMAADDPSELVRLEASS